MAPKPCPCGSSSAYNACCAPYHEGRAVPPSCEALMRSRFSGFALKKLGYLVKTLHPSHEDRALSERELLLQHRHAVDSYRYLGLVILEAPPQGDEEGFVLFRARVFSKGQDRSFIELSRFKKHEGAWAYESGELLPLVALAGAPEPTSIAAFREALARVKAL